MATKQVAYKPRLKTLYKEKLVLDLQKSLKLKNVHQVPRLDKIVLNIGLGRGKDDKRLMEVATNTMRKISGQQPIQTIAKKSIASFKLREGQIIGLKVTMRGDRMYEFYDRLVSTVLPRLRDFHGVSNKSFDQSGNFSIGIPDHSVFPELSFEETTYIHGLQVTISVEAEEVEHSRALLEGLGMPFAKEEGK